MKTLLHIAALFFLIVLGHSTYGQEEYLLKKISSVNSSNSEIPLSMMNEDVIMMSNRKPVFSNDHMVTNTVFDLFHLKKTGTYEVLNLIEDSDIFPSIVNVGSAYFHKPDSTLWYTTADNPKKEDGNTLKIFSVKLENGIWSEPIPFRHNSPEHSYAHPCLNDEGNQIFFSSDRPGTRGKLDLWYCNMLADGWSYPVWLGNGAGSSENEIFPVWHKGDLYYATEALKEEFGYDIYRATKKSQWKDSEKLPAPINSTADDFHMMFINGDKGYLSSNRDGGKGEDDIYYFSIKDYKDFLLEHTALLECMSVPLQNAKVSIYNDLNELLVQEVTSSTGRFPLDKLEAGKSYRIEVEGVEEEILNQSFLYVINPKGKRVRVFELGGDDYFTFEYLPGDGMGELPLRENIDESVLSIEIEGQVYEEEPGDIGAGHAIYITDEVGNLLALSYTSEKGVFNFPELRPLADYVFKMSEESQINYLEISRGEEVSKLEVKQGKAEFERLKDSEAIKLMDENNRPIFIKDDEVFIIKNIYYEFERFNLNTVAQAQLQQLAAILKNNHRIDIELSSHTDCRGEDQYNLELSDKRAAQVKEYLESQMVSRNNIKAVGYGESRLLNHCTDDVECTDEQHAINRRTEIKILVN